MNDYTTLTQLSILKGYFPELTDTQKVQIDALFDLYSDWNSKINVISRKDIENLYLHHVLHSLGITHMLRFKPGSSVMDLGTGGGFPGIPLAIFWQISSISSSQVQPTRKAMMAATQATIISSGSVL